MRNSAPDLIASLSVVNLSVQSLEYLNATTTHESFPRDLNNIATLWALTMCSVLQQLQQRKRHSNLVSQNADAIPWNSAQAELFWIRLLQERPRGCHTDYGSKMKLSTPPSDIQIPVQHPLPLSSASPLFLGGSKPTTGDRRTVDLKLAGASNLGKVVPSSSLPLSTPPARIYHL